MANMLSKNITYLLDKKVISSNVLLKITNHNSPGLITMWKNGERNIMTKDAISIANYLNITLDELVNQDLSKRNIKTKELDQLYNRVKHSLNEKEIIFLTETLKKLDKKEQ